MQYGVIIDEEKLKPAAIFYRDDAGEFIKEAGEYVCMFQTLEDGRMLENLAETAAAFQKFGGLGFIYHEDYANTIPEANGKRVIKLLQKIGCFALNCKLDPVFCVCRTIAFRDGNIPK